MIFNPNPKKKRFVLKKPSKAWTKQVDLLYERDGGLCQRCQKWLNREEANPHHKKTRGAGGGDEIENLELLCSLCHIKIDSGEFLK